jgi:hypothetical protein
MKPTPKSTWVSPDGAVVSSVTAAAGCVAAGAAVAGERVTDVGVVVAVQAVTLNRVNMVKTTRLFCTVGSPFY